MTKKVSDKELLILCLTGKTQTAIANELNMTKAQICRRINTDSFQAMLSEYRKRILDGTLTELTVHAQKSVLTLVELLDSENEYVRMQAATKILSLAQDYGIQNDILREIRDLRETMDRSAVAV